MHHNTAIISKEAKIGENVIIGPYSIIEDDVEIGDNTEIRAHVHLANGSRIGRSCRIHSGCVIATEPQDLKFGGEPTLAIVGDRTVLREFVTVNRGTKHSGMSKVGSDCLLMAYCHVAHDCRVGNNVIMANATQLGGHVQIDDWANTGGVVKVHQFCRVGMHSFVGADVKIVKDVPPFTLIGRDPAKVEGINKIGLRRRGFTPEQIDNIEEFYKVILNSGLNVSDGIRRIMEKENLPPEVLHCIEFIKSSERGIVR